MQALDAGTEVEVLAFNALGELLVDQVLVFWQQPVIGSPVIGAEQAKVEVFHPIQQGFQRIVGA